ncbi:MAG: AmmeMemoRadiSam system protein B [Burkholderiales bacterium]|nr:AmmeMemoRadiSam system protein B [Burkholderiales bacterium]
MDVRPEAVAGMFYPAGEGQLRQVVQALLAEAPARLSAGGWPKAVIVPHAGYVYSGSTAAHAFAQLAPSRGTIRRVVLLGPVHRVPVRGLALPGALAFRTPLGTIPLDQEAMRAVARLPQVGVSPRAHAHEHSLEVQLPFLQEVLGDFALLPLAVGDATAQEVGDVLEQVWGDEATVVVVSSDLSHYLPSEPARATDRATVDAMLAGRTDIDHRQACGATPVNGLLAVAPRHGLAPRLLKLCNSGDTSGDKTRVVGYASLALEPDPRAQPDGEVPAGAGSTLLPMARNAIARALGVETPEAPVAGRWLQLPRASFVTLREQGALRGCIGSIEPVRPLVDDVRRNAVAAALHDHRFTRLQAHELDGVSIEVSLLTIPEPLAVRSEEEALRTLRPGHDGVVLHWCGQRATFLPQVWEQLREPREFMRRLKQKAGLKAGFWDAQVRLERYAVRKWVERA